MMPLSIWEVCGSLLFLFAVGVAAEGVLHNWRRARQVSALPIFGPGKTRQIRWMNTSTKKSTESIPPPSPIITFRKPHLSA